LRLRSVPLQLGKNSTINVVHFNIHLGQITQKLEKYNQFM
jgi:hypothetical protein